MHQAYPGPKQGQVGTTIRISRRLCKDRRAHCVRASIDFLQRGPKTLMIYRVELLANATRPRIVKSQPLPMASIIGAVTKDPTHEKMFRMKLFSATPADAFFGINSVNIVVAIPKIIMDPTPKKKLAIICCRHNKLASARLF